MTKLRLRHSAAILLSVAALYACGHRHLAPPTDHVATARAACADTHVGDDCSSDADCGPGTDCACDYTHGGAGAPGPTNHCMPSNCRTDVDCGPGGFCSPSDSAFCTSLAGYFCHGPDDDCSNDSDCAANQFERCTYNPEVGHWACTAPICSGG